MTYVLSEQKLGKFACIGFSRGVLVTRALEMYSFVVKKKISNPFYGMCCIVLLSVLICSLMLKCIFSMYFFSEL